MKRYFPLFLLLLSAAALAEPGAYRVEVIVFRNLVTTAESAVVSELRSFSAFPDIQDTGPAQDTSENSAAEPTDSPDEPMRDPLPDDLLVVTQKSKEMDDAWRRLRSSQDYRPLVYTAWDQNRIDYYPPMRIHNEQIIDTQLRPPTPVMVADLAAEDPLAAYRSTFFQIDGSLQLRRSRFLHLLLDLELRENKSTNPTQTQFSGDGNTQVYKGELTDEPGVYGVYTLKQNRQISTGEMQYFDTPYFGVLVYVSSVPVN